MRISGHDLTRIRCISDRLSVKDSDVFRFAIWMLLNYLSPMDNETAHGDYLVPSLIKCGPELVNYFDLDVQQLQSIVNGGLKDSDHAVDLEDIDLLVSAQSHESIVFQRLQHFLQKMQEPMGASSLLQRYLTEKYLSKDRLGYFNKDRSEHLAESLVD